MEMTPKPHLFSPSPTKDDLGVASSSVLSLARLLLASQMLVSMGMVGLPLREAALCIH